MEFQKQGQKFANQGVQLTRPVDLLAEAKYSILNNVRSYVDGTIHLRLGLSGATAAMGAGPVHSIKRYFDNTSATTAEIEGSGTSLYFNAASIASGFSGNPLTFAPIRPISSAETYMYVGDSSKMVKVNKSGMAFNIGIAPPVTPLSAAIGGPSYTTIEKFDVVGAWANGGTAGALSVPGTKRVNTTITNITYDTGTTGWACVNPAVLDNNIQVGVLLLFNGTETARVEAVFNPINTTTISSIKYDSGSTGPCTIQLVSTSLVGLERDAYVRIAAAENVRILSVTTGPDGIPSFRCSTTGTRAATDAVAGLASFRVYLTGTFAATNTLADDIVESSMTVGIGFFNNATTFNLGTINNRPLQEDDEFHLSIRLDKVNQLTEGKIFFNLDTDTGTGAGTFSKNYFYFPFTASQLTPAAKDTLTTQSVQQNIIQRQAIQEAIRQANQARAGGFGGHFIGEIQDPTVNIPIETPPPPTGDPGQTSSGDSQWTELIFKKKDLIRIGPDSSKTISNITALRIQFNVTATTVIDVDSFWVGGTYGLDSQQFPYTWAYCYKATATGITSNPSPPMRSPLVVSRSSVILTPTVSSDAQVDLIQYFRYGGTLTEWHFVGTSPNSGTFTDTFPDQDISGNFGLDFDNDQPFPVADSPRAGTCTVAGTEVTWVSGDTFNTAWARGSEIIINGTPTSLFTSPSSTTALSLEDNLGTLGTVNFNLPSPTLKGQAMRTLWGPYTVGGVVYMFACKSGTLYFTKGSNPDAAPEDHFLEITSPQEPLLNGCVYDGQIYVFSTERMFRIIPTLQPGDLFEAQEVPVGKGLVAPWALAVDELIYFVSRDGIYSTNGTELKSLTDADLYPLFPHDGQPGTASSTLPAYSPPDFTQLAQLRLSAGDGLVKFTSKDVAFGFFNTWVYDTRTKGWISNDTYTPRVVCHYHDEGGSGVGSTATRERVGATTGVVYTANSSTTDAGSTISGLVRTRSWDFGETRAQKLFGDIMLDHAGAVTVTAGVNSYSSLQPPQTLNQFPRNQSIYDILSGGGVKGRNMTLDLAFTDPTVVLYEWQPSFVPRPVDSKLRWMDFTDDGQPGNKYLQGMVLTADTNGTNRTVQVQGDGGIVIANLTVNHNGYIVKAYPSTGDTWTPQPTHMMRLVPSDANSWEIFNVEWTYTPSPEASIKWQIEGTSHGYEDFHHTRRLWPALVSTADVTLALDNDGNVETYTLPSTGGVYKKLLIPLKARKGKLWKYTFTSSLPFRLFLDDTNVETLGWGADGMYKDYQGLGGHQSSRYEPSQVRI